MIIKMTERGSGGVKGICYWHLAVEARDATVQRGQRRARPNIPIALRLSNSALELTRISGAPLPPSPPSLLVISSVSKKATALLARTSVFEP